MTKKKIVFRSAWWQRMVFLAVLVVVFLVSFAVKGAEQPLYVAIIWHQHQPLYKDPVTGEYLLPWVRMHSAKTYYDMVAMLKDYPEMKFTINLVPSLMYQINDYVENDARDKAFLLAKKPATELTDEEKIYILQRFFDVNWDKVIKKHSRYWVLLQKRGLSDARDVVQKELRAFTTQDFLDLQVLFNLAWLDVDIQKQDREISRLVKKGRNYTEREKEIVLRKHLKIMEKVLPVHREFLEAGQIEITTTPFYHPIMPLLHSTSTARVAVSDIRLPAREFFAPLDLSAQLEKAVEYYEEFFGRRPAGLWPSEQAVGQEIIEYVHDVGFIWMVSDEGVLSRSLGRSLRDAGGKLTRPEVLYRPYWVKSGEKKVAMLFRDYELSDKIAYTFSPMAGQEAAGELFSTLHEARRRLAGKPGNHVVTIALDGENPWEYYDRDGKDFLHALYKGLSEDPYLISVTVGEYLSKNPPVETIEKLYTGSWHRSDLSIWIGEEETNKAWVYLDTTRQVLLEKERTGEIEPYYLNKAWDALYAAEGSDWFWWYGDDWTSANDEIFDMLFRTHLKNVFQFCDRLVPDFLKAPIHTREPETPVYGITGLAEPSVDGRVDPQDEWEQAGLFRAQRDDSIFQEKRYGATDRRLYLRFDPRINLSRLYGTDYLMGLYFSHPFRFPVNSDTGFRMEDGETLRLGYGLAGRILIDFKDISGPGEYRFYLSLAMGEGEWQEVKIPVIIGIDDVVELSFGFEQLLLKPGDRILLNMVEVEGTTAKGLLPAAGPMSLRIPELTLGRSLVVLKDSVGDDRGPGTYTYPLDPVFNPGVFDLVEFEVLEAEEEIVFRVQLEGDIENPWNSPVGISVQTIDIYIDTDNVPTSGRTEALDGRNVVFSPESAWEYAVWVEGWHQALFTADGEETGIRPGVSVDEISNSVIIRVPKSVIGIPEPGWGFQVFLLGQEGFPSPGYLRVREVEKEAAQWRFGGGTGTDYDPGAIDMLVPKGECQFTILGTYDPEAEEYAVVPMIYPEF